MGKPSRKKKIKTVEDYKAEGNEAFKYGKNSQAIKCYTAGLDLLKQQQTTPSGTPIENDDPRHPHVSSNTWEVMLRSNRAMAYIKDLNFAAALADCNIVIDELQQTSSAKLFYRRALAQEGVLIPMISSLNTNGKDKDTSAKRKKSKKINGNHHDPEEQQHQQIEANKEQRRYRRALLVGAQKDLQRCVQLQPDMGDVADKVAKRLQTMVPYVPVEPQEPTIRIAAKPDAPSLEVQHRDILLLLDQRRGTTLETTQTDEAFFLIPWDWWCAFCQVTRLDPLKIVSLLPQGAVPPLPLVKDYVLGEISCADRLATEQPAAKPALAASVESPLTTSEPEEEMIPVLHPWLVRGHHYEILPREVYATLVEWYGQTSLPIVRRIQENGRLILYGQSSTITTAHHFPCAACGAPNAVKFCRPCQIRYCSRSCQERHWKAVHKQLCGKQNQQQNDHDDNNSNNKNKKTTTTNHPRVGLSNLGNTCFLNSAVQALAHTTPLVRYFLSGQFQNDINDTNPLGSGGGRLAHAFDATMTGLRMAKPSTQSYSPMSLKRALVGTRFAGCQQHDAQEFLGFVLDGLHEDLNRIASYDYVELPDVPADQPQGIAGAKVWDAQCMRNNSLLWDTFYGQFKSTCVCPDCQQLSVSFDSFNHVSLEIPHASTRVARLQVNIVRPDQIIERYGFSIGQQNATIKDLKKELLSLLAEDVTPPPQYVSLCEHDDRDITSILADSKLIVNTPRSMIGYLVNSRTNDNWMVMYNHFNWNTKEKMGVPYLLSFPKESTTCREVWEEIWRHVSHLVDHDSSKMRIRLMTRNGTPNAVFPVEQVEEKKEEGPEASMNGDRNHDAEPVQIETTSIWPSSNNSLVRDFISPDKFVFLLIEWLDAPHITDQALSMYKDHPTYTQMWEEHQAETKMASKVITLEQCLSTFQKPERLDEHNMWYCNKCKEHVPAMKTIELWRLPNILILHLKRFEFRNGFRREKLDMLVQFPLEGLEVICSQNELQDSDALVDSRVPSTYDCFAVINHYGRMGFGHYTAFARQWDEQGIQDNWYLFDDSRTQPVSKTDVISEAAYVLFYRRRESSQ